MIWQLKKHGHNRDELDKMTTNELKAQIRADSKNFLHKYGEFISKASSGEIQIEENANAIEEYYDSVREAITGGGDVPYVELYDALERIWEKHSYAAARERILSGISDRFYKNVKRILEVSFRAYQERLLGEIADLCEYFPKEEMAGMMKHYEEKRESISYLRQTIIKMRERAQKLTQLARLKLNTLESYFPDSMYENYEDFYEDDTEKNIIIERIMGMTKAYKRPYLRNQRLKMLRHIEQVLSDNKDKEREERVLFRKYSKQIANAMMSEDEYRFGVIVREAMDYLDERDVRRIVTNYDINTNPVMLQQFNLVLREHRRTERNEDRRRNAEEMRNIREKREAEDAKYEAEKQMKR